MNNPRLAARYAKSLLDLSIEQHQLDAVYADMKYLHSICLSNPDFVALLKSPIINADKKNKILAAVTSNNISQLTQLFTALLTGKHRESNLPEIIIAFIEQYNKLNNIQTVKLTTATAISDDIKNSIVAKVKGAGTSTIELQTAVNESLIGGFKLEVAGTLIDASILHDLNEIKKQFLSNEYIYNIR